MRDMTHWVTSHMWMSRVAHIDESRRTYEWVHVAHMNESCRTYKWVMSHIWMSRVAHMDESRRTYEWIVLHIWISYVAYINESCYTYEWVDVCRYVTNKFMSRVSHSECVMSHIYPNNWTHPYVWHDSFICTTWLIYMYDMPHLYVWHDSYTCVTWLIHMRDMTHSFPSPANRFVQSSSAPKSTYPNTSTITLAVDPDLVHLSDVVCVCVEKGKGGGEGRGARRGTEGAAMTWGCP